MRGDLTQGNVMKTMLRFAVPMILGNLLQQCYNVADTLIVGRFLGAGALAAVGSSFTLMTFLTSILLGLCMGSGAVFSIRFGQQNHEGLKECMCASFALIAALTVALNLLAFAGTDAVIAFFEGATGDSGDDAGVSVGDFLRHRSDLSVQLFCLPAAGGGQLPGSADLSGRLGGVKHRAGPLVCAGPGPRCGGGGSGDGDRPVCLRHRDRAVHMAFLPISAGEPQALPGEVAQRPGDCRIFHSHLPSAVGDEFRPLSRPR